MGITIHTAAHATVSKTAKAPAPKLAARTPAPAASKTKQPPARAMIAHKTPEKPAKAAQPAKKREEDQVFPLDEDDMKEF